MSNNYKAILVLLFSSGGVGAALNNQALMAKLGALSKYLPPEISSLLDGALSILKTLQ